jgi:serine phosphatase RsbU (regulator of sigma subunit)
MVDRLIRHQPRGPRLIALIVVGLAVEFAIALVGHVVGPSELADVYGALGLFAAIAVGLIGGAWAGLVVGGGGGLAFIVLIASSQPQPSPYLDGVPLMLLWAGLAAACGAGSQIVRDAVAKADDAADVAQRRISGLHRAVEQLAVTAESAEVARVAAREGAAALQAQGARVAIVNPATQTLDTIAAVGFADRAVAEFRSLPLDAPYAGPDVARTGQARFFADADAMAAAYPAAAAYRDTRFEGCAVYPLIRHGEVIGIIAFHFDRPRTLSDEEMTLGRAFADTAGQAFERARLFEEVLSTAEILQRSLLPFQLPTFAGYEIAVRYRPASDTLAVGGDWYDVVEAGHGQIGIAVGDVGGKGIEAAAIMGRLRTAMRAYAIEHPAPSDVMRRLVAYHARTRSDAFATTIYASLDRRQRRLRVASVGHPAPILVRAGHAIRLPVRPDPPLGIEAPRQFRELAAPIQAGDVIVLLSDGVIERRDATLDAGLQRVAATATTHAAAPVDDLADYLVGCVNGADAADDRALVVVRVSDNASHVGHQQPTSEDVGLRAGRRWRERTDHPIGRTDRPVDSKAVRSLV